MHSKIQVSIKSLPEEYQRFLHPEKSEYRNKILNFSDIIYSVNRLHQVITDRLSFIQLQYLDTLDLMILEDFGKSLLAYMVQNDIGSIKFDNDYIL